MDFMSKTPLSNVQGNVMVNGPRAMVNMNDGNAGGGSRLSRNFVANTCRVSGDHGAYNSWDRMPLANRVASGGGAGTFANSLTEVSRSMIIGNYGSSQGFDNDDGSSYYNTTHNVMYQASGFKMDYGGHDSHFASNLVVAKPDDNFLGTASFVPGHASIITGNTFVGGDDIHVDALFENCDKGCGNGYVDSCRIVTNGNTFYTPDGLPTAACDGDDKTRIPLAKLPFGMEAGFTAGKTPSVGVLLGWMRELLELPPASAAAAGALGSSHPVGALRPAQRLDKALAA